MRMPHCIEGVRGLQFVQVLPWGDLLQMMGTQLGLKVLI
jgi:hypothetical protein